MRFWTAERGTRISWLSSIDLIELLWRCVHHPCYDHAPTISGGADWVGSTCWGSTTWLYLTLGDVVLPLPRTQTSLSMCAQRKAGRRQPSVPFPWSLAVRHQSLVSRSPLPCEKRSGWGGGWSCHLTPRMRLRHCRWKEFKRCSCLM